MSPRNSIVDAMRNIGKDFQIPIMTRRLYAEQDRRDAMAFDYLGRTGVKMTQVELVKQKIFLCCESTAMSALNNWEPNGLDVRAIY